MFLRFGHGGRTPHWYRLEDFGGSPPPSFLFFSFFFSSPVSSIVRGIGDGGEGILVGVLL